MYFKKGHKKNIDYDLFVLEEKNTEERGGDEGDRTPDLLNAIQTLSQLSYVPSL